MPIYEYVSLEDHEVVEVLRAMSDADKPLTDPAGKGRTFVRKQSTFAAKGVGVSSSTGGQSGGCCPCGKGRGSCSSGR